MCDISKLHLSTHHQHLSELQDITGFQSLWNSNKNTDACHHIHHWRFLFGILLQSIIAQNTILGKSTATYCIIMMYRYNIVEEMLWYHINTLVYCIISQSDWSLFQKQSWAQRKNYKEATNGSISCKSKVILMTFLYKYLTQKCRNKPIFLPSLLAHKCFDI